MRLQPKGPPCPWSPGAQTLAGAAALFPSSRARRPSSTRTATPAGRSLPSAWTRPPSPRGPDRSRCFRCCTGAHSLPPTTRGMSSTLALQDVRAKKAVLQHCGQPAPRRTPGAAAASGQRSSPCPLIDPTARKETPAQRAPSTVSRCNSTSCSALGPLRTDTFCVSE